MKRYTNPITEKREEYENLTERQHLRLLKFSKYHPKFFKLPIILESEFENKDVAHNSPPPISPIKE